MSLKFLIRFLPLAALALPSLALACSGRVHIELEHAGVYTLDHAAIVAAQPGLAECAADDLVLTWNGEEVPLRVVAAGPRFQPGDRIEWIGRPLHGPESWFDPYSVNNTYLLAAAPGPHARMRDAAPDEGARAALQRRLHLEQENLMIRLDERQQKPGEEPDVWMWAKLTQVDPAPYELAFDLPDLDTRGVATTLTLNFRGLSELRPPPRQAAAKPVDHQIELTLNGQPLEALQWDGRDEVRKEITLPSSQLRESGNSLVLGVPRRKLPWDDALDVVDVVMFNWLEARYPLAGDLGGGGTSFSAAAEGPLELAWQGEDAPVLYGSDGLRRPGVAAGAGRFRFAAAGPEVELFPLAGAPLAPAVVRAVGGEEWQAERAGYDYLIVAHRSLIDSVRRLAEFHEKRGLKVAILDIADVYDQFNHGITHPRAVRNLVSTAWHQWPVKPRFLLLVGSASFDIRNETYNDTRYAKWTSQELLFPNHFGAIPGTPAKEQLGKLADRNLIPTWQFPSAEGQSASDNGFAAVEGDDWHPVVAVGRFPVATAEDVTAIVDKTIDYMSQPQLGAWRRDVMFITDEIESFKQASNEIASDLGREGFVADKVYANPAESDNAAHQRAIHDSLDEGRLLVHFIGHGGRYIWRTGPPDLKKNNDLFTLDDVGKLNNGGRLPMILSMTCYSAPFDNPTEDSIGERFLRERDKGAVAVFAASWRNSPSPAFSKSLITELLEPGATIGEAIVRAKQASKNRTLVEMYNLLGDPAVVLERPRDEARVALDGDRWNPSVLVDLGYDRFQGNLRVDWVDAKGARLASGNYRVEDARFRLPVPAAARGQAAQVQVYAVSPMEGRDANGGLELGTLQEEPAGKPWRESLADWWREFRRPPYQAPAWHADTIMQVDFDDPDPAATAAARQATTTATGVH
ncbi:MAG: hypothetical protein J0H15_11490 [Xanthomonadales bacterium]|nr:hypothetical protein [Xanthomonadales bacterium]